MRGDTDECRAFCSGCEGEGAREGVPGFVHDGRTGMRLDGGMSALSSHVLHRELEMLARGHQDEE